VDDDIALRRQRQRGVELRNKLRALGDRDYDPDWALLKRFSPFFARFTGHTVGQQSLEYALLLLFSDDRVYGSDDQGEANRIIRKILEYQDLRHGSETYGNFRWMTHWDRVKDRNAVSFLTSGLVYAYVTFPAKLHDDTRLALEKAFPDLLAGIRNHKVRWQYTNIFWLNLGGLVGLARVLGDQSVHDEAVRDFETWLDGTAEDGVHEFNSPTYTPVTLFGVEAAWANTNSPELRARLERLLHAINYQLAVNLFPNGFLGGAASRAYQDDALYGTGWGSVYSHVKFGTPSPPILDPQQTTMYANLTLFDYVPPAEILDLATRKAPVAEIHDRVLSANSRRTHVMTPTFSLSSQTTEKVGGHSPPPYVLLVHHAPGVRRSVPILPDESFSHQPCAIFHARQSGARVVGRLHYDLDETLRAKFLADHTFVVEPRVLFGRRPAIAEVRVGNVDWAGGPVRLRAGQTVAVSYGDIFLGIAAQFFDRSGRVARGRARLSYGDDDELRLALPLYGGADLEPSDDPLDGLLLVDVAEPRSSLAEYAEWLGDWQLRDDGGLGGAAFAAAHPSTATLAYPYGADEPDPIGDALHVSPDLTLRPGDLRRLVDGRLDWPLVEMGGL
jgi:hypothetical protein